MTEPITVDVPLKSVSVAKPVVVSHSAIPKPAEKAEPAKTAAASPTASGSVPPGSSQSLLARIVAKMTKKNATIGASALFSLAAGIAGVRLMLPGDEPEPPQTAKANQPLAPAPDSKPPAKLPSVTIEPSAQSQETIPPPMMPLPTSPARPATGGAGGAPSALPPVSVVPALPTHPSDDGFGAAKKPEPLWPALPLPPARPTGPIIAISGSDPATPVLPDTKLPDPKMPLPDVKLPDPKMPLPDVKMPVQGSPVGGSGSTPALPPIPSAGGTGTGHNTLPLIPVGPPMSGSGVPVAQPDLGLLPPAKSPSDLPLGAGTKLEFTKPATPPVIPPIGVPEHTPTTSFDVDIYEPKAGDNWEAISREFYNDSRYAAGLRAYNRNKALQGAGPVDVPPIHIVKRYVPGAVAPAGGITTSPGMGASALPDTTWGAATSSTRAGGDKTFRIPQGGMSMRAVARLTLGSEQRFDDIYRLNPHLKPDDVLPAGTDLKLPPDARNPG